MMHYVYMLQSVSFPGRYYVGLTEDLTKRFHQHNGGESAHTSKFMPWTMRGYVAFFDESKAQDFEVYLKTASGRAFAKKHF
jgi:putative endonuclease